MKTVRIVNPALSGEEVNFKLSGKVRGNAAGEFEVDAEDARVISDTPGWALAKGETLPAAPRKPTRAPTEPEAPAKGAKGKKAPQEPTASPAAPPAPAAPPPSPFPPGDPAMSWPEEELRAWLRAHDVEPDPDWTKPMLLAECTAALED